MINLLYIVLKRGCGVLVKAYVKDGVITLITDKKKISYNAGEVAHVEAIGEKSPYALFSDFDKTSFKNTVSKELARIYALSTLSKNELISSLDKGIKERLYTQKEFKVSLDVMDGEAVWVISLESAIDLFAIEIISVLKSGKTLKKCKNCGGYFFPSGRSDSIYCDRISKEGYSCKKIGTHRQYRKNSRADEIKKLYDKITKHNRYLKSKGTILESDYNRWIKTASSMYADFKSGAISERTLTTWLEKDISTAEQSRAKSSISDYLL